MGGILIGFLNVVLFCAIVIFIAFIIVWLLNYLLGIVIDANVMKWGKVIVALICAIAILTWLFSVLGVGTGGVGFNQHFFYQR